jgi:hypothetical protein
MSSRDQALSDYVRKRIRDWKGSGRELQELARIASIAKSSPSQVLLGTGVAKKTGRGYARAFGFHTFEDLQKAAYEWWLAGGEQAAAAVERPEEDSVREAIEILKSTMQATEAQLRTILGDFTADRFRGRDTMFWVQTLGAEVKRDREALAADAHHRKRTQKVQAEIRAKRREHEDATAPKSSHARHPKSHAS